MATDRAPETGMTIILLLVMYLACWSRSYQEAISVTAEEIKSDVGWDFSSLASIVFRIFLPFIEFWIYILMALIALGIIDKILVSFVSLGEGMIPRVLDSYAVSTLFLVFSQWRLMVGVGMAIATTIGFTVFICLYVRIRYSIQPSELMTYMGGVQIFGLVLCTSMVIFQGFVVAPPA